MFDRPILIYSDYCIHSKNFLGILIKHPDIFNSFVRINVDVNSETKQRTPIFYKIQQEIKQKITKVPTLIISQEDQVFVLADKEAFKWLDFTTRSKREEGYTAFNQNEMGSFSDGYSKFGSTDLNDATEQNFRFYETDNQGRKILPGEKFNTHGNGADMFLELDTAPVDNLQSKYNNLENERQQVDKQRQQQQQIDMRSVKNEKKINSNDFNNRLNSYKQETNQFRSKNSSQQIDFTNENFGLSGKLTGQGQNFKKEELDKRLEQLMQDRSV